jgi:hypothetical protein
MTDAEREDYIKDCGLRMEHAYACGNRQAAEQWLQAQNEAIKGRSAAKVAAMEGCYFDQQGESHAQAMARMALEP